MKTMKYLRKLVYSVALILFVFSSCVYDSYCDYIFMNRTGDSLFIGASYYDEIDSVDYQLEPLFYDRGFHPDTLTIWNKICVQDNIIYPDSSFRINSVYLSVNNDSCYLFLVKWRDANDYSWDEIRMKKLYRRRKVVRNSDGDFDRTIQ